MHHGMNSPGGHGHHRHHGHHGHMGYLIIGGLLTMAPGGAGFVIACFTIWLLTSH